MAKCGCSVTQDREGPFKIHYCPSHKVGPRLVDALGYRPGYEPVDWKTDWPKVERILAGIDRAKKGASHGTSSKKQ